jgi:hypothetical protein
MRVKTCELLVVFALFLLAQLAGFAPLREHGAASSSVSSLHKHALSRLAVSHWSQQRGHRIAKVPSSGRGEICPATSLYDLAFGSFATAFAYSLTTVAIFAEIKLWLLFCSLLL